ncbi:hypothetical protein [Streptomyces sp. NPDC058758]|uniref:hypothetical protein n=1 Tax=Streptomyces sp. NPDC058758 TaxID=3346627 RepID=UPI0036943E9B
MSSSSPAGALAGRVFGTGVTYALGFSPILLLPPLFSVELTHGWLWFVASGFLAGAAVGFMPQEKHGWITPLNTSVLAGVSSVGMSHLLGIWASALYIVALFIAWILGGRRKRKLAQRASAVAAPENDPAPGRSAGGAR